MLDVHNACWTCFGGGGVGRLEKVHYKRRESSAFKRLCRFYYKKQRLELFDA